MPQVLKGIALLVSTITAAYASATLVTKALVQIGATIALTKISTMLGPKAPRVRDFPQDVEYSDTMASRRILYGENKVSGMNVIPPLVTGTEGAFLHQVLALAGHEIEAINTVYFSKEALTLDGSGNVSGGTYSGKATVRKYTGTSTQTVDTILFNALTEWTADHRGRGIAYLALRYEYDTEVYRSGKPDVTCIVQGKKVYDPRLDTSPGANPTDATYAAYSTNPALCLADYLISSYGLSESAARIDWSLVVAAANICDEDVNIPGSTTQKRFTCNMVLDAVSAFETNIEALALAMMGTCYYSGGKWRMYAGAWSSSAFSLTADNIVGELAIQTAASRKSDGYYNAVRGRFIDKDRDYQPLEFEPILNSTYESADGERIYTEVDFPGCNNQYEAQRNAIILSKQSRRQKTVTVVCDFSAYKIRPWETGTATIAEVGWSNQPVRCVGWRFRPEPAVELTLQEVASTDYDDPDPADYVTPASVSVTSPAAYKPGSPQSFTATQEIESILLQWQAPTNTISGILYQVFEYSSATPFASATKIYEGADTQLRVPRTDTDTRYFWVRSYYRSTDGYSAETPSGNGLSSSGRAATVSGYLTNEAITLEADSNGTISDYSAASGFFKVFSGTTDVTSSATFAEVSETNVTGDINTADNTPVSGQVKGYYRVTALSGADTGIYKISAAYGGATITKDFTVTKAQDGTDGTAVNIYLSQTGIAVPADSDGTNPDFTNASTTVTIYENQNDVSASWSVSASPSSGISGTLSTRTYTLTGMTVDTGYVEFTATRSGYDNLVIRLAVTKVRDGSNGTNGTDGLSAVMTLESVALLSYADGTVVSFTPAAGRLYVYSGGTDVTASSTLSATATGCTGTVNTATDTPVSGQPKGYYRVTAMSADTATLQIDATYSGTTITKIFSLSKNKVGYEIVGTLPSTNLFEGRVVFLTTDDKLYRYNGTTWTAAVPTSDLSGTISDSQIADLAATKITGQITETQITDSAVTTAKIFAGAVTTAKLAANSVVASKMLVTGLGDSITDDVNTQDITAWTGGTLAIVSDSTSPTGSALRVTSASATTYSAKQFPIDATKNYNARIYAKQVVGTPNSYLLIAFYDASGNLLDGSTYPTGWPGVGTYHYFGVVNAVIPSSWTEYQISFGPDETAKIPSGAASLRIGVLANYFGGVGGETAHFTRFIVSQKASGQLIVDGAITADKIAANAVTADKINAGAVTAAKISVTNLAAINADMGSITAGDIVLPSGGFIRSGQTAFDTGTGFYLGNDSGTPKFSIGNASGKHIKWDGSDFTINGGIVTTGSVAANAITLSGTDTPADVTLTVSDSGVDNTLSTVTISTSGSTNVLVRCDLTFKFTLATGGLSNIYKIKRGGTTIATIPITSLTSGGTYRVPLQYLDSPSSGSISYTIEVQPTIGGSTTFIYEDIITVATEFKR